MPENFGFSARILPIVATLRIAQTAFAGVLLVITGQGLAGEPDPKRQLELRNLVKHDCGACHGLKLTGGLGPSLLPSDLTGKTDATLIDTVLKGRKGTAMPPWERFINKDEAAWLIELLKYPEN